MRARWMVATLGLTLGLAGCSREVGLDVVRGGTTVLAAFGDSITTGANSAQDLPEATFRDLLDREDLFGLLANVHDNPALSWATGTDTRLAGESLGLLLERATGNRVFGRNYAVSGATSADLASQVAAMEADGLVPGYVTLLIGGNDLCHNPTPDQVLDVAAFRGRVRDAVDRILARGPEVRIVIAAIPRIPDLWDLRSTAVGGSSKTCRDVWEKARDELQAHLCDPVLLGTGPGDPAFTALASGLQAANEALEEIASAVPERIRYAGSVATEPVTAKNVSMVDCFHPSIAGQRRLARLVWEEGWITEVSTP